MKVELKNPYGYCAGVQNVIDRIEEIISFYKGQKITCVGQIVHNKVVNDDLIKKGVVFVSKDNIEEIEKIHMSEEECIRRQAKETDYMMELLLQNLEEKGLIDNTVIVVFADHYLYTIENIDALASFQMKILLTDTFFRFDEEICNFLPKLNCLFENIGICLWRYTVELQPF